MNRAMPLRSLSNIHLRFQDLLHSKTFTQIFYDGVLRAEVRAWYINHLTNQEVSMEIEIISTDVSLMLHDGINVITQTTNRFYVEKDFTQKAYCNKNANKKAY